MICASCDKELTDEARFCIHCGTTHETPRGSCATCAQPLEPDAPVCPNCWSRQGAVTDPAPPASAPAPEAGLGKEDAQLPSPSPAGLGVAPSTPPR